jgi:hypothetical protein
MLRHISASTPVTFHKICYCPPRRVGGDDIGETGVTSWKQQLRRRIVASVMPMFAMVERTFEITTGPLLVY